jgi:hypothetical protein
MNEQLRYKISNFLLQREIRNSNRQAAVIPFSDAKSIGILYDATQDQDYELIKNYVKDLRGYSKDVLALGYYNRKELPATRLMKLGLDFFTQKALNWKLKPNHPIVTNFMNREFDILICMNLDRSIPIRYISSMTKAKFKIGKYDPDCARIFDFMIKVEDNSDMRILIEQVNHYLKLIRNEKYQET